MRSTAVKAMARTWCCGDVPHEFPFTHNEQEQRKAPKLFKLGSFSPLRRRSPLRYRVEHPAGAACVSAFAFLALGLGLPRRERRPYLFE